MNELSKNLRVVSDIADILKNFLNEYSVLHNLAENNCLNLRQGETPVSWAARPLRYDGEAGRKALRLLQEYGILETELTEESELKYLQQTLKVIIKRFQQFSNAGGKDKSWKTCAQDLAHFAEEALKYGTFENWKSIHSDIESA